MALPKVGSFRYNWELKSKERLMPRGGSFGRYYDYDSQDREARERFCCWVWVRDGMVSSWKALSTISIKAWEFGRSDPRNVIFSAKQGLALVIVTLLVFLAPPFKPLSQYAVWAILTVVVVFEFSIGATFIKGFNRGLGTLLAGGLALGAAELAIMAGEYEEVIIIASIFITGFWASFVKLYPTMKQYEYGFRVFLLTFCFVMMSGYRTREFIETVVSRSVLIAVGAAVSLAVNVFICPIWSGEDLHNSVMKNFTGVASSLEGCVNGYLECVQYRRIPSKILVYQAYDDPLYSGYRSAIESESKENSLKDFAFWEPPHGRYMMLRHPWNNYVKLSSALRHCAFVVLTMHGCILSEIQAQPEKRQVFSSELRRVGAEGAKVVRKLGDKVKKMEKLGQGDILFEVHQALVELQKKIDGKSYHLVNSGDWEISNQLEDTEAADHAFDIMGTDNRGILNKSLSETVLRLASVRPSSPEIVPHTQVQRPALGGGDQDEVQSRTYESASALSLATFASLLIEFVARLQNVVSCFQELGEKASFKEPIIGET
ncbi:hypothetical protein ACLOJK_000657 [Asimina triloba]